MILLGFTRNCSGHFSHRSLSDLNPVKYQVLPKVNKLLSMLITDNILTNAFKKCNCAMHFILFVNSGFN